MTVPEGYDGASRAELMIALPPGWKLAHEDLKDENWYWTIRGQGQQYSPSCASIASRSRSSACTPLSLAWR